MLRNRPTLHACKAGAFALLWLLCLALSACSGGQSALDPQGPVAESIARVWWVLFAGALIIFGLVMALVLYAMFRSPERKPSLPHLPFLIGAGLLFPAVVLTALVAYGTVVGREITRIFDDPLRIEVTGHQWWWEVRYPADDEAPEVLTANELWLPVGVPVEFTVESADVVHSFWIPNLGGKVDMIPGRRNLLRLEAARAGRFRGQCSEFCGDQHSRMGFMAVAVSAEEFAQWRRERARPVRIENAERARFDALGCAGCHGLGQPPAQPDRGPSLTHFAQRPTVGAGAAAHTPESLRRWLADHGARMKPGNRGPSGSELAAEDIEALARLLEQPR
jgi:cytochrome c oxidase subunit 2